MAWRDGKSKGSQRQRLIDIQAYADEKQWGEKPDRDMVQSNTGIRQRKMNVLQVDAGAHIFCETCLCENTAKTKQHKNSCMEWLLIEEKEWRNKTQNDAVWFCFFWRSYINWLNYFFKSLNATDHNISLKLSANLSILCLMCHDSQDYHHTLSSIALHSFISGPALLCQSDISLPVFYFTAYTVGFSDGDFFFF